MPLNEDQEIEYINLLEQEIRYKATLSFWAFCCVLSPDFYKPERKYLKTICDTLQALYEGKLLKSDGTPYRNLNLEVPPRHGKSRTLTNFSAWCLGRSHKNKIITISFNDELAQDFSRFTRDIISEQKNLPGQIVYSDIFDAKIKQGDAAAHKWALEGQFFNYKGAGIQGNITGRGGNCFVSGTMITTDKGKEPIEAIHNGSRVLSYNHGQNIFEWKRVISTKQRAAESIITITTNTGDSLSCTRDHRIYVFGKEYVEAEKIKEWDALSIYKNIKARNIKMHALWERIYKGMGRIYQKSKEGTKRFLLLTSVLGKPSRYKKQQEMSYLRECNTRKAQEILFVKMSPIKEAINKYYLYAMRKGDDAIKQIYKVLLYGLQKHFSLKRNEREKESELYSWNVIRRISGRVSKEEIQSCEKDEKSLRCMWFNDRFGGASQRQKPKKQHRQKSNCGMQELSLHTSYVKSKFIRDNESVVVYDIQVEDNNNFFANGILVHNCIIIDDPIKDAETAYNEGALEKIWLWYTGTFFSRPEKGAITIICMTPWCKNDLGARAINSEPDNWYKLTLPAFDGESMLCPDLLDYQGYQRIKAIGDGNIIAANYDMLRLDVKGRLYTGFKTYEELPESTDGDVGYTDTADEGNDFLCSIQAKRKKMYLYVTDILYTKEPQEVTEPKLADMIRVNGTRDQEIESNNGGRAFARNVQRLLDEKGIRTRVNWFHQSSNKIARILTNASSVQEYVIFPWNWKERWPEFYSDLMSFQKEGKNKHDDAPDALTGLVEHFTESNKMSGSTIALDGL